MLSRRKFNLFAISFLCGSRLTSDCVLAAPNIPSSVAAEQKLVKQLFSAAAPYAEAGSLLVSVAGAIDTNQKLKSIVENQNYIIDQLRIINDKLDGIADIVANLTFDSKYFDARAQILAARNTLDDFFRLADGNSANYSLAAHALHQANEAQSLAEIGLETFGNEADQFISFYSILESAISARLSAFAVQETADSSRVATLKRSLTGVLDKYEQQARTSGLALARQGIYPDWVKQYGEVDEVGGRVLAPPMNYYDFYTPDLEKIASGFSGRLDLAAQKYFENQWIPHHEFSQKIRRT